MIASCRIGGGTRRNVTGQRDQVHGPPGRSVGGLAVRAVQAPDRPRRRRGGRCGTGSCCRSVSLTLAIGRDGHALGHAGGRVVDHVGAGAVVLHELAVVFAPAAADVAARRACVRAVQRRIGGGGARVIEPAADGVAAGVGGRAGRPVRRARRAVGIARRRVGIYCTLPPPSPLAAVQFIWILAQYAAQVGALPPLAMSWATDMSPPKKKSYRRRIRRRERRLRRPSSNERMRASLSLVTVWQ